MKFTALIVFVLVSVTTTLAQTIAERLGYGKDAKLLIVHADDIGVANSVNKATLMAFKRGGISSASIMVPCAWFFEIAEYIKTDSSYDFGLHLTLTAEWNKYKWGGVSPADQIPGLLNENGFFYASVQEVVENATAQEVETEIRAQVLRSIQMGVKPTHLDSHMGTLFAHPDFFKAYQKVAKEFKLPILIPSQRLVGSPLEGLVDPYFIPVNDVYSAHPGVASSDWVTYYNDIIKNLQPGLSELIIHVGYDNDELQAVTVDHPEYGSAWRQRDLNYVLSNSFKNLLKEYNVKLVTYRELGQLMNKNN